MKAAWYIGGIIGGVVWIGLFVWVLAGWAVGFFPGNSLWRNLVFGGVGTAGFVVFVWVGGRVGTFIASKPTR